jgi:hypothetical protein
MGSNIHIFLVNQSKFAATELMYEAEYKNAERPTATAVSSCLIATTEPDLFASLAGLSHDFVIQVHSNGAEVLEALNDMVSGHFIADYRQLNDRWTGQRFLKQLRENPEKHAIQFWLMAESWHPEQEVMAIKQGASGIVKRNAEAISALVFDQVNLPKASVAGQLEQVEGLFANFAGLMKSIHINAARLALASAKIESTPQAYISELSRRLSVEDSRLQFLEAAKLLLQDFSAENSRWTSSKKLLGGARSSPQAQGFSAEKIEHINSIYRNYAGALGARLTIQRHSGLLTAGTAAALSTYVHALADGLSDAARRNEFFSGLQSAGLL